MYVNQRVCIRLRDYDQRSQWRRMTSSSKSDGTVIGGEDDGKLSLSDEIALEIGIGLAVSTLIATFWSCLRGSREKK